MASNEDQTEKRKKDHLEPFRDGGVGADKGGSWLECVRLVHQSLPELKLDDIDINATFAGHSFEAPLFITGMTGGAPTAGKINRSLARVAERLGIGFGLGSQRAMLENPGLSESYMIREAAAKVFLAGNLGGVQAAGTEPEKIREMLEIVQADAFCIHLNPAQEMMQPEGDRDFRGVLESIGRLVDFLELPVIVKETGSGLSRETVLMLKSVGVNYLDVAGSGGTSWIGVEILRRNGVDDPDLMAYWDWGIPTAAALSDLAGMDFHLIGSGGVRTGLDVARTIALGARMAGVAAPAIQAYFKGGETECERMLQGIIDGLKTAMLLTGCRRLEYLMKVPRVITGDLLDWMKQRALSE